MYLEAQLQRGLSPQHTDLIRHYRLSLLAHHQHLLEYASDQRLDLLKSIGAWTSARQALPFAAKAARLGDGDARAHAYVSAAYLFCGQHDLAEVHSKAAVSLNANDPEASYRRGLSLVYGGDPKGGLEWLMRATHLDTNMPQIYKEAIFDAHYMAREYDRALEIYRSWPNPFSHGALEAAACHAQLGRVCDMQNAVEEFIRRRPENFDVVKYVRAHVATCPRLEDREHWIEGYRKTGLLP